VVKPKWDTEATKTTGLVAALRAESEHPRCDVFWNNEVSQTIGLARDGLLAPYESPAAAGLPAWAMPSPRTWTGFAARARVLIVNTDLVPEAERPSSIHDLADPTWKGRCAIAKPLFGTTATHVAALFAWDEAKATEWLEGIKANQVVVCAGNADVKDRVAQGELAFGLTDTDDANLALLAGKPVAVVFPDQEQGGLGTLLIPNAVSILKGAPHLDEAQALVDYLVSAQVEEALAEARSVQVPLRDGLARVDWMPPSIQTLPVAWDDVGARFADARAYVKDEFLKE
jgi:iron(III) transport system substrate-binding protein